jgi:TatD DNase family protein
MNQAFWIDTHAHVTHGKFRDNQEQILTNARDASIKSIISAATCAADALAVVELAHHEPLVKAAVGIHPNDTHLLQPGDWDRILNLADDPVVVAIGETGLDRYWKDAPFDVQQESFVKHLELAEKLGLPVVIHCRDAMTDILNLLEQRNRPLRGTMHCFIGSLEDSKRLLELGLHLGIGGISTFANKEFDALRDVIREIPQDRLLVETDAPFLSPHPFRGKMNEPSRVAVIGQALAALKGWSDKECAQITTANAESLFRRI